MIGKGAQRVAAGLFLVTTILLLTTGCWDRAEINELAIVFASGIDWEEDHWVVTAGIVQTAGRQGGGGGESAGTTGGLIRPAFVVSARGATVLEAQQNLGLFTARRPRWDHAAALIIGEAAAKRGIEEILDLWTRSEALRTTTMVGLVRGKAQDFIVEAQPGLETSLGETLPGIIRLGNPMGISATLTLHRLVRNLSSESHASIVTLFGLVAEPQPPPPGTSAPPLPEGGGGSGGGGGQPGGQGGQSSVAPRRSESDPSSLVQQGRYLPPASPLAVVQVQGTGIIFDGKLAGYLDLHATRGVFWLTAPPSNAVISASCPGPSETPEVSVLIEDIDLETKVSSTQADIALNVTATLNEQACLRVKEAGVVGPHAVGAEEKLAVVAAEVAKHIEGEIRAALAATQRLGADVFGFGVILHRQNPGEWERIKNRWPDLYRNLPVTINVKIKFVSTGLTIGPPTITRPPANSDTGSSNSAGSGG